MASDLLISTSTAWSDVAPEALVNDATRRLLGRSGDWDPPAGVVPKRDLIRMAIGIPDPQTIPRADLAESADRVIREGSDAAFAYGFGMGFEGLREQVAERYRRVRGLTYGAGNFQLANGSAGAIDLICRCLIERGDVILCEAPTYMGTLRNFHGVGAEVVPVQMDADGLDIDALAATVDRLESEGRRIKFIYTISSYQNPTGATLTESRRIALLEFAARRRLLILDDDAYGDLHFGEAPPRMLAGLSGGEGVLTVGTFSKILATGMRIGWIAGPAKLVEALGAMRFAMGLNQIMLRVMADYMGNGRLDAHIGQVRGLYRDRMERLASALDAHAGGHVSFVRPQGGFYLWLGLQDLDAATVWRYAAEEGVAITPGVNFYPQREDPDGDHLRVAFPWTPVDEIEEGARRIGLACVRAADAA